MIKDESIISYYRYLHWKRLYSGISNEDKGHLFIENGRLCRPVDSGVNSGVDSGVNSDVDSGEDLWAVV